VTPKTATEQLRRRSSLAEKLEEKVQKFLHRTPATGSGEAATPVTEAYPHRFWPHLGKRNKEDVAPEGAVVPPVASQAQVH